MFFWFVFLGFFVLFVIGGRLFSGAGIIVLAFLSLLVACDEGHGGKGVDSTVPLLLCSVAGRRTLGLLGSSKCNVEVRIIHTYLVHM